jgi:hypothetical protein
MMFGRLIASTLGAFTLTSHRDNKVIAMLEERQHAAVRGVRRGEWGSFFLGYGYDGAGWVDR